MGEISFHTTYSDNPYLLTRAENGFQSGLQRRECHRFGFNGKENDNEVKGTGNQQDYGMRIYDPRLGRFLSVDPITSNYPELTPYQFASNRPIDGIDLDGLEYFYYALAFDKKTSSFSLVSIDEIDATIKPLGITVNSNKVFGGGSYVYGSDGHFHNIPEYWQSHSLNAISDDPMKVLETVNSWENADVAYLGLSVQNCLQHYSEMTQIALGVVYITSGIKNLGKGLSKATSAPKAFAKGISGREFSASEMVEIMAPKPDDAITLFRGMKSTEGGNGALFLTESKVYASSYSSNVKSFTVSRSGYNLLKNEGIIETFQGLNSTNNASGFELKITNQNIKNIMLGQ
ncbi:MAG: hypothetical protein A2W93_09630 [Bacteroidetes bacterium GWF2_43_63]|nr:MAG: hypothetical protein A2W94_07115 [Bacteroidetes bacterium GWE2_42_42]OFY54567.1 MAG: hypothetical protein A2W93_09630 [Bacteroidetes bacterium GWF2_43_63]HBG70623.1 hypothetical protein [Bacteroidales bacterium]HCB60920.1 hypothetical protein [Bacteroidales bacterium]